MQKQEFKHGVIYQGDALDVLDYLEQGSFHHVLTDPPYGYLKHEIETMPLMIGTGQEKGILDKIKDKITPSGGIAIFGRGDLFFEWNLHLNKIGFKHKEDCLLYKNSNSSPVLRMKRNGEYFTIRGLKGFSINVVKIPMHDKTNITDEQIVSFIRRASADSMYKQDVLKYLQEGIIEYNQERNAREEVTVKKDLKGTSRNVTAIKTLIEGSKLSNVLFASRDLLEEGSHPTIKPEKEMQYIIQCISEENQTILDCFIGSGTTYSAAKRTNRRCIGIEKNERFFQETCERIHKEEVSSLF